MSDNKPIKKISKRYFTFFGGIAFCLIAVILILNGKVFARAIAFPFAFAFGMASYVLYILVYSYGLSLFFREKGFKIRLNNYFFGGLLVFISILMVATLIVRSGTHYYTKEPFESLTLNNFASEYDKVLYSIENLNTNINLEDPDEYRTNKLVIFDRWGNIVYSAKNYDTFARDGQIELGSQYFDGANLGDGVYYYHFYYKGKAKTIHFHGSLTILR